MAEKLKVVDHHFFLPKEAGEKMHSWKLLSFAIFAQPDF